MNKCIVSATAAFVVVSFANPTAAEEDSLLDSIFPMGIEAASDLDIFFALPYKYLPFTIAERAVIYKNGDLRTTKPPRPSLIIKDSNGGRWEMKRMGSFDEYIILALYAPPDGKVHRFVTLTVGPRGWSDSKWQHVTK